MEQEIKILNSYFAPCVKSVELDIDDENETFNVKIFTTEIPDFFKDIKYFRNHGYDFESHFDLVKCLSDRIYIQLNYSNFIECDGPLIISFYSNDDDKKDFKEYYPLISSIFK